MHTQVPDFILGWDHNIYFCSVTERTSSNLRSQEVFQYSILNDGVGPYVLSHDP